MNDVLLVMVFLLILFPIGYVCYAFGQMFQKRRCRHHKVSEMSEQLNGAVDEVLRLEKELALIKMLEYERVCKEDLMQVVHKLFFFREFKNPGEVCNMLEEKMNQAAASTCFTEENQAVAEMYRKILEDIRPSWLEGEKP